MKYTVIAVLDLLRSVLRHIFKAVFNLLISAYLYIFLFAVSGTSCFVLGIRMLLGDGYAFLTSGIFFLFFMAIIVRGMKID